jgi:hypothetical protein
VPAEYHVTPAGTPGGDGTRERPWDLATALAHPAAVKPGDTIWVHAGTYPGPLESRLAGTPEAPVVLRAVPGDRVTIDGVKAANASTFVTRGHDAILWGLEFTTSTGESRVTAVAGSDPGAEGATIHGGGVDLHGPRVHLRNCYAHDLWWNVGSWSDAPGANVEGCFIYHNGWQGPDRGHGHGCYIQNAGPEANRKAVARCAVFDNLGWGLHAYTEQGAISFITFEGNTCFNNSTRSNKKAEANILYGGSAVGDAPILRRNRTMHTTAEYSGDNLGFRAGLTNAIVEDNVFGSYTFHIEKYAGVQIRTWKVNRNTYYRGANNYAAAAAQGAGNRLVPELPATGHEVYIEPDPYEPGRAMITVFNWEKAGTVPVDVAGFLPRDTDYEVRDGQNPLGPAILTGTADGTPLALPMTLTAVAPVTGRDLPPSVHTGPEFGVFLVAPAGTLPAPDAPPAPPAPKPEPEPQPPAPVEPVQPEPEPTEPTAPVEPAPAAPPAPGDEPPAPAEPTEPVPTPTPQPQPEPTPVPTPEPAAKGITFTVKDSEGREFDITITPK